MAITLDVTGILQAAAFWVSNQGGNNSRKLYFYFYALLTCISMVIGNDPVILSGTAFLVYYTSATGLEPMAWLIAEFAAANTASMVLFVGNPTNVVICEGFRVNNAAFTAYTILPFIACSLACYGALAFQFCNAKHVPSTFAVKSKLNPRDALRDPVSAIFGGILLLICLALVIVLSFFHVDVWKIVLPFAVTKFIFDLSWDHYRSIRGRLDGPKSIAENRAFTQLRVSSVRSDLESGTLGSDKTVVGSERNDSLVSKDSNDDSVKEKSVTEKVEPRLFAAQRDKFDSLYASLAAHFPTFFTALPRLPFALIPFAFSQFILIEGLAHQGWIDIFATWLVKATNRQIIPTIWVVGVLGVILCNVAGTNIGATILLTKVVYAAPDFPASSARAAAIALAVASNIGAVSFTFSASLAGLLWKSILNDKGIKMKQSTFAFRNCLPLLVMTVVGLAIVTAEMSVLY
jgi:Na+/H+ antiporter NhaD/arsenite permease-like protein